MMYYPSTLVRVSTLVPVIIVENTKRKKKKRRNSLLCFYSEGRRPTGFFLRWNVIYYSDVFA